MSVKLDEALGIDVVVNGNEGRGYAICRRVGREREVAYYENERGGHIPWPELPGEVQDEIERVIEEAERR